MVLHREHFYYACLKFEEAALNCGVFQYHSADKNMAVVAPETPDKDPESIVTNGELVNISF